MKIKTKRKIKSKTNEILKKEKKKLKNRKKNINK